ncbi:hypothetical protein MPTK2_3g19480 [Marchantia polymorpha subsp. ruderalis]
MRVNEHLILQLYTSAARVLGFHLAFRRCTRFCHLLWKDEDQLTITGEDTCLDTAQHLRGLRTANKHEMHVNSIVSFMANFVLTG